MHCFIQLLPQYWNWLLYLKSTFSWLSISSTSHKFYPIFRPQFGVNRFLLRATWLKWLRVISKFSFLHSTACDFIHNERLPVHQVIQLSCVTPTVCIKVCVFPCPVNMWSNIIRYTTKAKYTMQCRSVQFCIYKIKFFLTLALFHYTVGFSRNFFIELVSYENSSCG